MPETVWAIHNFEAEAEDEISFHIGEPIIVVQKDELYQDGWWERVANALGGAESRTVVSNSGNDGNGTFGASATNTSANLSHIASGIQLHNNNVNNNNPNSGMEGRVQMQQINQALSNGKSVEESLSDPQLAGHPALWSIEQVAYWLECIGFGNVSTSFIDNEISGAILLELNLNNLKELEINSFGKRFNIMNAITTLKQSVKGPKSPYGTLSNSMAIYQSGPGPNIPPRMASAPINLPSVQHSYNDYMHDPRQGFPDPRSVPMAIPPQPSSSVHSPNIRQHHPSDYEQQARSTAIARSDTLGSHPSGGGSMGDYPVPSMTSEVHRAIQRQSLQSAYSTAPNPWNNVTRPPQSGQGGPGMGEYDDMLYGGRPVAQPSMDQYPRPMDQVGPTSPDMRPQGPYGSESYQQPVPKPRKYHNPDNTNRQRNGKADPSDKIVPLDLIGKPDFQGYLKKRGDTYRTWKSRWFILKGVTLYYMNSPKDVASKDYINLIGYKIIQDENIYAGKYCFKAVHDELRNFFFYTESESDMKGWLKALMKVTIGRDPTAPVISSSNIPTISLHVARKMAPRPPSPSKRPKILGPNGQSIHMQQHQYQQEQMQQQQRQLQQQQQDLLYHQQLQSQQISPPPQAHPPLQSPPQQKPFPQQLLDFDDQESDGDDYLPNTYEGPRPPVHPNVNINGHVRMQENNSASRSQQLPESPILQGLQLSNQHQRNSIVKLENLDGDDDPWRDEDGEGFNKQKALVGQSQPQQQQQMQQPQHQQQQQVQKTRPDSHMDSFGHAPVSEKDPNVSWTQEQYVDWINRNLPDSVEPVGDMTTSLRSGVVLVRLIEQLSGEHVDKRIPNATYTLQMLENLLTAFKFMDRVGISTDGYTVKDIFNGNEPKIILMFDSIRAKFPTDTAPSAPKTSLPSVSIPSSPSLSSGPLSNGPPALPGPAPVMPVPRGSPHMNGGVNKSSPRIGNGSGAVFPNSPNPMVSLPQPPPQQPPQQPPVFVQQQQQQQQQQQRMQVPNAGGSEFEALYDEAARSTVA
ncbi:polar growth protein [Gryganskiella cystojenkinii]|nr:polar growth protein [Gryganskiella cystojenkinii]